jgi:RimJ/RimL family protein N-acetyltransferase
MPIGTHPNVTLTLRDGLPVRIRPVTRADRDLLAKGFQSLSEMSRNQRFFTPVTQLSGSQLTYLTDIDHIDHFAWGIETEDGIGVGIARYVRTGPDIAEAAFTIADDFQGRGLGWTMLRALALVAADHELRRFEMTMLADNDAMTRLARKAGARFEAPSDGTIRAELDLNPAIWSDLTQAGALRDLAAEVASAG